MNFTGNEGGPISRETAKQWIENYESSESAKAPEKSIIKAHFFGREKIQKLLDQEGCVGLRVYYGKDSSGVQKLFMVGANSNMDNLIPEDTKSATTEENIILDDSWDCPPYCPNNGF